MGISRRDLIKRAIGASSILAVSQRLALGQSKAAKNLPNIVILYADDLGYGDLGCYGGDIPTPNVDSLAKQGIRFTDFHVMFPACTPSRFSLLTGRYMGRALHGLHNVLMPGSKAHFDPSEKIIPEFLKPEGYATGIFGKWHLGGAEKSYYPTHHGFDEFIGHIDGCMDYFTHVYGSLGPAWYKNDELFKEEGYSTDLIATHAIEFMDKNVKKKQPYFVYVPFNSPHYGKTDPANKPEGTLVMEEKPWNGHPVANTLQAPQKYIDKFANVKDEYRRYYSAMVSNLDDNTGRIMDYLKKNNQMENTIIWWISDNGGYSQAFHGHSSNGPLRGQKGALYEGGHRIPAMVCWEGKIKPGQVCKDPLGNVDIVPTLGAIVGFSDQLKGLPIDGKDISDVLFKGGHIERDLIWTKVDAYAVRRGPWKLVTGKDGKEELYNLDEDLGEKNNVAEKNPDKVKELHDKYVKYAATLPKYEPSAVDEG